MDKLEPKDHAEAMALFRSQVLGPLLRCTPRRGELAVELERLADKAFRPTNSGVYVRRFFFRPISRTSPEHSRSCQVSAKTGELHITATVHIAAT